MVSRDSTFKPSSLPNPGKPASLIDPLTACGDHAVFCRCARIFAMTSGSSMLSVILSFPPLRAQASIPGLPMPRRAGVTAARRLPCGANSIDTC